jgi:hypothetical protein
MKNRGVRRAWWVVAAAVFAATPHLRAQAITSNWLNPVGGFWLAASNWSSNPNAPRNGTPAGATYDAMVNLAGTYTISGSPSSFT